MRILFIHKASTDWDDLVLNFEYEGDEVLRFDPNDYHPNFTQEAIDVALVARDAMEGNLWAGLCPKVSKDAFPYLLLANHPSAREVVYYLDSGYQDVVRLPVEFEELKARMQVAMRTHEAARSALNPFSWQVGELELDLVRRTAKLEGSEVQFTTKEWMVLALLLQHRGKVLERRTIAEEIFDTVSKGHERTVDVYVRRVREKLHQLGWSDAIQTKWGEGYYFVRHWEGERR